MKARGGLHAKLALSVLAAFAVSMVFTRFVHGRLSRRDAEGLIARTFTDVSDQIASCVDRRLLKQAMAAREHFEDGGAADCAALAELARELNVTEIVAADASGKIVHSSVPEYIGFDFRTAEGQAREMLEILDGMETEICQKYLPNSATGVWRKYVTVWRPEGGFVQISCDGDSLRELAHSSLVGISRDRHVGGDGGIVVTTPAGLVLSDYAKPNREGTQWTEPDDSFYWAKREVDGFTVYVMIPKATAAVQRDVLVAATAALNGAALVFVALLVGLAISSYVRRQLREQTERELKMAAEIQNSSLPRVFPPFPEEPSFDVYAMMKPAKEVGGDFYDFCFTGPRTLTFLVADVSGKGIPAAMFMMRAKALLRTSAQAGKPLAQAVAETNDALCEGNAANVFVTCWVGSLNIDTGALAYVNAGHNPPAVLKEGGAEWLGGGAPNLVLGAMPGVRYRCVETRLGEGDALYLYTDGVTEQHNAAGELFGEKRLLALLSECGRSAGQKALLEKVQAAVAAHSGGVEQADDCTQLTVRFRGECARVERAYAPTMEDLAKATADLEASLEGVPPASAMKLMVAADEIFANIVKYSGATGWTLRVERVRHPDAVRLVFTDDGKPFDPLRRRDPDTTLDAAGRQPGGLGILIVKKTMSPVEYTRRDGRNILTMGHTYGTEGAEPKDGS